MKRTLSIILAVLLLASGVTACSDASKENETKAETIAPETDPVETDAPEPAYDTGLVAENGVAKAHIVIAEGADPLLTYAAEELVYHIKLVSGAEISIVEATVSGAELSVTNTVQSDSLPIIIGTPTSNPELEALFPEDIAWLRDTGGEGSNERWGDDGFAIRMHDGKLYIFGATAKGAQNGVYDFIEENMGVLWLRTEEMGGTIYDEMPTIRVVEADYSVGHREKSPFQIRSWNPYGVGLNDLTARRKNNTTIWGGVEESTHLYNTSIGLDTLYGGHNVKLLVRFSPIYDPTVTEYWQGANDSERTYENAVQVNYWSDLAVEAIAANLLATLDAYDETLDIKYLQVTPEDRIIAGNPGDREKPFEYAPGQFVYPEEEDYISTVFYTFLNKVARRVGEKYPDVMIATYTYWSTLQPPRCDVDDNILIIFCPIEEDLSVPYDEPRTELGEMVWNCLSGWVKKTKNMIFYNYYGCAKSSALYERAIWYKIQSDYQYYAENGLLGLDPVISSGDNEGAFEYDVRFTNANVWEMNSLTYWIVSKLAWNPYEDVDALIVEFCDKVYGAASPYMQEYYRLIQRGWEQGSAVYAEETGTHTVWNTLFDVFYDYFVDITVDGESLLQNVLAALNNAWDAANDAEKERIRHIKERYEDENTFFPG